MRQPLSRQDLDYYHHLLEMGFAQNELIHCADNIRTILDRFDRTRLPSGPGNTGAIPWQRTGTPHGKQKMSIEATR
jgi:hypothetical protein